MGTAFNPQTVQSGFRDESLINQILADIQTDLENKLDRNGLLPNAMNAALDAGTNKLINVSQGNNGTDGVNLNQVINLATQIANSVAGAGQGQTTGDPITFNFGVASGSQGTSNRTVFDLTALFGVASFLGLTVVVNGVVQIPGVAYSVTDETVTFVESLDQNTDILFIYGDLSPTPVVSQTITNYDLATFVDGSPSDSQAVLRFVAPRRILFQDDFEGSQLDADTAANAESVFTVSVDGSSVGTITVAASGTTGTFATTGGEVQVEPGEVVEITAPSSADATLADVSITLNGARN